jgi:hypothetical protein
MRNAKIAGLVAAALVAGLVLGTMSIASAATTSTTATAGNGMGGFMRQAGATLADVVGKLTGQSADAVRTQREAGTSFADIAKAKGVSADKVAGSAIDARKAALAAAVKAGTITQQRADLMLDRMQDRVTDRVNSTAACTGNGGGCGGGGCGGAGNGGGNGGGGCGGACLGQ